ncbi:MAG: metallophosphoesterase [Clostridia bacterium]|nr:metallophosphoesterase [Clostridia bacterium]
MKKFFSILFAFLLLFTLFVNAAAADAAALSFGSKDTFTVLQLTDPQDDAYPAHKLLPFLKTAIETTKPDFIILTGDIVEDTRAGDLTSDAQPFREGVFVKGDYGKTLANVKAACAAVFGVLEQYGIPYAVAMGNNDYKAQLKAEDWLAIFAACPHCVTVDMSDDAEGHIDTYFAVEANGEPVCGLLALDNGKSFNEEQLNWLKNLQTGGVPCYAFEHIALDETNNLYEVCSVFDDGAIIADGKAMRLNQEIAHGHTEGASLPGGGSAQFPVLKEKNTVAAFFGHYHTSGYTGVYDGMTLGLTYGCQFAKSAPYGARTVTIHRDDPARVDTTLFVYENGALTPQVDAPYHAADNGLVKLYNLFATLLRTLSYTLKF